MQQKSSSVDRRQFVQATAAVAAAGIGTGTGRTADAAQAEASAVRTRFEGPDSLCVGSEWETLNPGYWQIKDGNLRRRLVNIGQRARSTGFPFHSANAGRKMQTEYDPSLPNGILYRRDWKLESSFEISGEFVYFGPGTGPQAGDDEAWRMYQPKNNMLGLAFGAKSLFESFNRVRHANQIVWSADGKLRLLRPGKKKASGNVAVDAPQLKKGDTVRLSVRVDLEQGNARITASMEVGGESATLEATVPSRDAAGFVGICAGGLMDFGVSEFTLSPESNKSLSVGTVECYSCYPLGDTLRKQGENWKVKFVALFDSDGTNAEVRVATEETPDGGWQNVPVAGKARIVNHQWRRNTAVIEASLPASPAKKTLYYTVWKDGENVTSDPRIGTAATGPGTGLVGDVPKSGAYVGRLPRLTAPYKLCGLSCHAITSGLQRKTDEGQYKMLGGGDDWQFRDQPTQGAYQYLEEYDFQIMVWEDDVWYMELVLYPPSTDDAYKVIKNSICGPTSRWQMMRHWNVINPGDHDYGMDDVKGPEQIAIRRVEGLGQDTSYMKRNFQIVHHLVTGAEEVDPLANPKKWRAWKMPNRDFTFVILDSRLWRSSQDTDMWDDQGWGAFKNLYDRTDPTRSLLGEEQFAWLERLLQTDSSPLICLTGINGMHTVWTGQKWGDQSHIRGPFDQRDRVTADYAGWVKAGADRVLQLLGSRDGVVTVYGDVHNGCIMRNEEHGVYECSFGPIGRSGGRSVIPGFGRKMKDFDGRSVEVFALYHKNHADPDLQPHAANQPFYWNFLEMEFDPRDLKKECIGLRVRNMVDRPTAQVRGGGQVSSDLQSTGRAIQCRVPSIKTLAMSDVRFETVDGMPLRGTRSDASGNVQLRGLVDIAPGQKLIWTATDGKQVESGIVTTKGV